jgi:hypothetical protein
MRRFGIHSVSESTGYPITQITQKAVGDDTSTDGMILCVRCVSIATYNDSLQGSQTAAPEAEASP